ncbi:hydroxylase [Flexivirga sp. ID2601S]|uniref:Hydroxylase n=1 Tax=Flexivirga aerilata TaxID=1656889 RepID=A0A849ALB9_9MICO|nr:ferritin-like fold-containing protein [Flexivirga aerilata]NNG39180.1 hydroxylase [Flexivirga aerilata]
MSDAGSAPAPRTPRARTEEDLADPAYRRGVAALLGVLAYGELTGFFTIAQEAAFAPRSTDKESLARVATVEFAHYEGLAARLRELGVDPHEAMAPFTTAIDEWHRRATPSDWLEALMKVYVGNSIATDFYREVADYVDPATRGLVRDVLEDGGQVEFAAGELRRAIAADAKVAGRLALWGRRMVGEALSQAQRVAADDDDLMALLVDDGSGYGLDLGGWMHMFTRITDAHTARMESLGLSA